MTGEIVRQILDLSDKLKIELDVGKWWLYGHMTEFCDEVAKMYNNGERV